MNIKLIIKILILVFVFYLSYSTAAQNRTADGDGDARKKEAVIEEESLPFASEDNGEMEDEDIFSYDQEFFLKKLYQRKLSPMTKKEKILWSFRLADTNAFL